MSSLATKQEIQAIGITSTGNQATVNNTSTDLVKSVGGTVSNGNLKITVNGVESADIPLPESGVKYSASPISCIYAGGSSYEKYYEIISTHDITSIEVSNYKRGILDSTKAFFGYGINNIFLPSYAHMKNNPIQLAIASTENISEGISTTYNKIITKDVYHPTASSSYRPAKHNLVTERYVQIKNLLHTNPGHNFIFGINNSISEENILFDIIIDFSNITFKVNKDVPTESSAVFIPCEKTYCIAQDTDEW